MRLHYALLVVVAVLATCSSAAAVTGAADDVKILATTSETRFLRAADTKTADDTSTINPKGEFIEHKLQRALTNPKKTQRLYKTWYNKGYTAKDVANQLDDNESRELEATYKALYTGYAAYVKEQQSKQ
ncbi:avirulence protein 1b [Phytophthora sojae]|uniref:RxLR effector protein n=2 Tax=Phytophthora sojae TaxID=67593 RepID=G4ZKT2_PHYSP|nr:avirulence protein 1b [Phytophthora sojae]AEK80612.1 Avh75 [Phytophthora sojae]AEK80613.1 Avh75 [Phytophthora sojae]AEK80614.1 Avh75 [Phytophthora sojae]EGZ14528.1 avirulence protein 1b [Phytophthora sojae]|eukprot:XP_009528277.1 avirulence protein 1b [Phytophthora sojae]